jgi:hypothetical protein
MKKGTVLYLTDAVSVGEEFDEARALAEAGLDAGWAVFAAEGEGWYGVADAQRLLIERGATHIEAVKGRVDADGVLRLFGEPLRVFG